MEWKTLREKTLFNLRSIVAVRHTLKTHTMISNFEARNSIPSKHSRLSFKFEWLMKKRVAYEKTCTLRTLIVADFADFLSNIHYKYLHPRKKIHTNYRKKREWNLHHLVKTKLNKHFLDSSYEKPSLDPYF